MTVVVLNPGDASSRPRIAWSNLLEDSTATITTDSEDPDYVHQQAYDWMPHTHWKPLTGGTHYITAVFGVAKTSNYLAFHAHDLDTNAGTLTLQYSTDGGSTWLDAASVAPSNKAPIYVTFAAISAQRWRISVNAANPCKLGVVAFGQDMQLEKGQWIGFTPPELGRQTDITTIMSDNGTFLGRSVIKNLWASGLDLDFLSFGWVYSYWLPFMKHAELKPFFIKWSETRYPTNVSFCWVMKRGDIDQPKISKREMMSAGIKFVCVSE